MHRDTYRLAAMYASLDEYREAQPQSYAEMRSRGEIKQLSMAFDKGTIDAYRTGGRFNIARAGKPPVIRRRTIELAARRYPDIDALFKAEPDICHAARHLDHVEPIQRFYDRPFSADEIYEEAGEYADWDVFATARPKYASEAVRLGLAEGLRQGPGDLSFRAGKARAALPK